MDSLARASVWGLQPALALAFMFLAARPVDVDPPSPAALRARRAQLIVEELREGLSLDPVIDVTIVAHHPLVFSVERSPAHHEHFVLSMELGFLLLLDETELRAAIAHELGHVWIFTHHPYLHTERLANEVARRVVQREALASLYSKLWAYERKPGTSLEQLLGPGE